MKTLSGSASGMMFFSVIDLIRSKRWSGHTFMARLSSLAAGTLRILRFWRLDDVRGWRFGRIRGVLGKCGHLFSELGILLHKLGILFGKLSVLLDKLGDLIFQYGDSFVSLDDLCFELRDPPQMELFLTCLHNPLLYRLSDERGPPLEGNMGGM